MIVNAALAIIVVPATGWFARVPESIPRIQSNLAPLIDFYSTLQRFVDRTLMSVASGTEATAQAVAATAPTSVVDYRSEEHASELQSLMRNSYAVFCLKKKKKRTTTKPQKYR